ncbi:DUF3017 domain-containing protein [Streptomyces sp. 549]|uniref:DUF3017 domain-containing protein n=1 Tax=Streptomyces sp. 549 TaxID=3049076 RepID=UPI0024C3A750|nr:DUF3017 domain-containing protein [Streptomyces sp. 549]MDK1472772.1 DUF3017 domain-containing protein [Streptomyces sp. 549]
MDAQTPGPAGPPAPDGRPVPDPGPAAADTSAADAPTGTGQAADAGQAADVSAPDAPAPEAPDAPVPAPAPVAAQARARERRRGRRFPVFTRGTARPEGGGRAAPGDAPAPYRQWPLLTVMSGVGLGLLLLVVDARLGALVVGASVLAGAALRRLVPSVGMLAVRSRFTDLLTYGTLGTLIVLLALMLQPDPWLEIPFLKDILRFSVS